MFSMLDSSTELFNRYAVPRGHASCRIKISYSYFALRRLSDVPKKSDGVLSKQLLKKLQEKESRLSGGPPTVSGGFNVYAPGHIVLENSIDMPKKAQI